MIQDDTNPTPSNRCLTDQPTPIQPPTSNEALELRALKASESQKALRTRQEAEASMEGQGEGWGYPLMTMGVDGLPWHPPEN